MIAYSRESKDSLDPKDYIKMRFAFILADIGKLDEKEREYMLERLPPFLERNLENNYYVFMARDEGVPIAMACLRVYEVPSHPLYPIGRVGDVMNVVTLEAYRGRGIATTLVKMVLDFSEGLNLDYLELSATNLGVPIYQSCGFEFSHSDYVPMRFNFKKNST